MRKTVSQRALHVSRILCRVALLIFVTSTTAWSVNTASADDDLWQALTNNDRVMGRFEQRLFDEQGELVEESFGSYKALRPHFFRWEISDPDQQEIIVDSESLWHYDIDLGTATRRPVADSQDLNALEVLTGDADRLSSRFSVSQVEEGRYRLLPQYAQAGFVSLELTLSDNKLVGIEIVDRSAQQIVIELAPDDDASSIEISDFEFIPPDGVEVFDSSL
ncbi:MAG: outer membrane lipoprotein chaperone LolA [Pseudomonadota bacterium]